MAGGTKAAPMPSVRTSKIIRCRSTLRGFHFRLRFIAVTVPITMMTATTAIQAPKGIPPLGPGGLIARRFMSFIPDSVCILLCELEGSGDRKVAPRCREGTRGSDAETASSNWKLKTARMRKSRLLQGQSRCHP